MKSCYALDYTASQALMSNKNQGGTRINTEITDKTRLLNPYTCESVEHTLDRRRVSYTQLKRMNTKNTL